MEEDECKEFDRLKRFYDRCMLAYYTPPMDVIPTTIGDYKNLSKNIQDALLLYKKEKEENIEIPKIKILKSPTAMNHDPIIHINEGTVHINEGTVWKNGVNITPPTQRPKNPQGQI